MRSLSREDGTKIEPILIIICRLSGALFHKIGAQIRCTAVDAPFHFDVRAVIKVRRYDRASLGRSANTRCGVPCHYIFYVRLTGAWRKLTYELGDGEEGGDG